MKFLEKLKPQKKFDGYNVFVYRAQFRGSVLPDIGQLHRKEFKEDEKFELVAVTRNHRGLPDWYGQQIQTLLFEGELRNGINSAMAEYAKRGGYDKEDPEYGDIKKHGILPYLQLESLILDHAKQEVVVVLRTEKESNLSEHGIVINRKKGKWRFDEGYLSDYLRQFEDTKSQDSFLRKQIAEMEAYLKECEALWKQGGKELATSPAIEAARCMAKEQIEVLRSQLSKKTPKRSRP